MNTNNCFIWNFQCRCFIKSRFQFLSFHILCWAILQKGHFWKLFYKKAILNFSIKRPFFWLGEIWRISPGITRRISPCIHNRRPLDTWLHWLRFVVSTSVFSWRYTDCLCMLLRFAHVARVARARIVLMRNLWCVYTRVLCWLCSTGVNRLKSCWKMRCCGCG